MLKSSNSEGFSYAATTSTMMTFRTHIVEGYLFPDLYLTEKYEGY
jgi:hypothetical protein